MSSNDSPDAPAGPPRYALHLGDCRDLLGAIATDAIDAIVTERGVIAANRAAIAAAFPERVS